MTWLKDDIKVQEYIRNGTPCSGDLILHFYVRCKRLGRDVPKPIEEFITEALSEIVRQFQQGLMPDYNSIFNIHFHKGRRAKSLNAKLSEMVTIGLMVETYIEEGYGFEEATGKVAEARGTSPATVRKIFTEYRKWEE
ncbi:hypothetical protein KP001_07980 [Geomonas subterranea]|uniref:Uncharacterized protein n=1 Tax=Geomonas subterranea TaxID=2847989 RepID=A0ABX8LKB0_9BACT|nr:hypothetical protein [Geomonas subterranea]QXE92450.1 hypothetical protein KP001_07980 [Geomonas subterranea]QXM09451.1 hypothetical protein KP002_21290 [Geomonas subterranea]